MSGAKTPPELPAGLMWHGAGNEGTNKARLNLGKTRTAYALRSRAANRVLINNVLLDSATEKKPW